MGKVYSGINRKQRMRRRFTPKEDEILARLAKDKKDKTWEDIAKHLPGRTACQCRDRYNQYLYTKVEVKPWTKDEDDLIITKYREIGPHWVTIAQFLPGRSGTNIKNRWNTALVKFHGMKHDNIRPKRRNGATDQQTSSVEYSDEEHEETPIDLFQFIDDKDNVDFDLETFMTI